MEKTNKISVTSSTKNLSKIRNFVEQTALNSGLSKERAEEIILAVDEACTNIIKYTYRCENNHKINIHTFRKENKFFVEIIYRGKGFDPNEVKIPDMKEYFKNFKVGGLGIPLMRKFVNKIEYSFTKPNLNKLVLIKQM